MEEDEVFEMSQKEVNRHHLIRSVLERKLTQAKAAGILDLCVRQVKRLCTAVRKEGARGIVHGLRGRPSNRQLPTELLEQALCALHDPLWDGFGPTFAREKLEQYHGIRLGRETVRQLMLRTELWRVGRKGWTHRQWRKRRDCLGMMTQLDGSDHEWFEGRGPRCVLLAYVDDATSRLLWGQFVNVEDTLTLMRTTWSYLKRWGRPLGFYVDRDSIYRVNKGEQASEEGAERPLTQFSRAMQELGIEVICANSPQAKGRVERGFLTHQDRLVKELRLRSISSIPDANRYLIDNYIPEHDRCFSVPAAKPGDSHRPLLATHRLERILCVLHERTVLNDYTLRYGPGFLQLLEVQSVRVGPGDKVQVEERLDGSRHVRFKGAYLEFKQIPKRPYRPYLVAQPSEAKQRKYEGKGVGSIPAKDHPWRQLFLHGPHRVGLPSAVVAGL